MRSTPPEPAEPPAPPARPFRVAFVAGVAPDKWVRRWRERMPEDPLELSLVADAEQREVLTGGTADMSFVRLPVDREGLHVIPLYAEVPVAVLPREHELTLLDELTLADLAGEQLVQDPAEVPGWVELATVTRLDWPAMTVKDAIEVVASGTGVVVVPMSVARLHARKDVVTRPVLDGPESQVGLAWLKENEDPRVETFVGIVRGRTERSSRADAPPPEAGRKPAAGRKAVGKKPSAGKPARRSTGRGRQQPRRGR